MSYGSKRGRRRRTKQLIILRGLPGTGKSELASELVGNSGIICSSDDYFREGDGEIVDINPRELQKAHMINREKALEAIEDGYDPVIIDNTNMAYWEMYPYVLMGFKRGYFVRFIELPGRNMTPQMDLEDLYRRCNGYIPMQKLRHMQNSYEYVWSIFPILDDDVSLERWSNHPENNYNNWGGAHSKSREEVIRGTRTES
ncbi:NEDD4-binding protein 2-like 2 [Chanos chanos]|uniref:NEDD4-binding protein 2-like 2 n=1 Tax=Chanos chanos TaxID=29144 RepID=A0A6J2WV00_CHACN|nr:NEDD4-binding protein 2-like 1 [Chanos chanos]